MATPRLRVLESLSDPGKAGRPNEDRAGWNDSCAFVIDGATGLGDGPVMPGFGSDAAWLAQQAKTAFESRIAPDVDLAGMIAGFIGETAAAFDAGTLPGGVEAGSPSGNATKQGLDTALPRYSWPAASFAMLRLTGTGWEFAGLGDCAIFIAPAQGDVRVWSPLPAYHRHEQQQARQYIQASGGFRAMPSFRDHPEALAALRAERSRQNTAESGVWTLGLVGEAAVHLARSPFSDPLPATGLICGDGFADLVDLFARYTPASLIEAAQARGLRPLLDELRTLERETDPEGKAFPRFKQSDDATAILFEIV